ncbi:MAG: FliM/FliN family flagellar motor C-terminal domain-containing protein [Planctomycetaceae bacterium]|jgi:flagellar motor switch/type III secretory pathway protein FliN|nr:FliM/FliN family flagellar motor C-terminal domain-containing protein [Planctomycetaceae bacterium]
MAELNSSAVNSFIEAVNSGANEAVSAFSRTFDAMITVQPGNGGEFQGDVLSSKIIGGGLAMLLVSGGQGIAILIPNSTGLIPAWCEHPDATGKSKLSTFAQEWGMNLIPEDFFPEDFQAAVIQDLMRGVFQAQPAWESAYLELIIGKPDGSSALIYMIWPLEIPNQLLLEETKHEDPIIPGPPTFDSGESNLIGKGVPQFDPFTGPDFETQNFDNLHNKHRSVDDLPSFSRSILKIKIPVAAVLARAPKSIKTILELGVGSVIQFDKSCDDFLEIEVGQSVTIATAEAVKVGDKFGFRINSILLPEERFRKVEVRHEGEYRVKRDSPQIIGKAPIKSLDKQLK